MKYTTEELEINDEPRLGIRLDEYDKVLFVIGRVSAEEIGDTLKLSYHYDIIEGSEYVDRSKFDKVVGDFIMWYTSNNLEQPNPVVFTGGTDELRDKDNPESYP
jgi:hypothetical protein